MLTTIEHLNNPAEVLNDLRTVQLLGDMYRHHVLNDPGGYCYHVHVTENAGRAGGIHASEISKCYRRLAYGIRHTERRMQPIDSNMLLRFKQGTAIHAMLQNDFDHIAAANVDTLSFQSEVPINPERSAVAKQYDIHSSCDGVFTFWQGKQATIRVGLEIKTASDNDFKTLKGPKPEHLEQATLYMACLDLPILWFLYFNKNSCEYTPATAPFLVRFSHGIWDTLQLRFLLAADMTLPERMEGIECRWCPFAWSCQPTCLNKKGGVANGMRRQP